MRGKLRNNLPFDETMPEVDGAYADARRFSNVALRKMIYLLAVCRCMVTIIIRRVHRAGVTVGDDGTEKYIIFLISIKPMMWRISLLDAQRHQTVSCTDTLSYQITSAYTSNISSIKYDEGARLSLTV